MRFVQITD